MPFLSRDRSIVWWSMLENDQPVIVLLQSTTFHFCFWSNCSPSLFFSSNLRNRVTVIYVLAYALLQAQKVIFLTKKIISMDRRTPLSGPKIPAIVQMIQLAHISFYILEDHMVLCCLRSILFWVEYSDSF